MRTFLYWIKKKVYKLKAMIFPCCFECDSPLLLGLLYPFSYDSVSDLAVYILWAGDRHQSLYSDFETGSEVAEVSVGVSGKAHCSNSHPSYHPMLWKIPYKLTE